MGRAVWCVRVHTLRRREARSRRGFAALWMVNTIPGLAFEIIYPFVNEVRALRTGSPTHLLTRAFQMIVEIGVTDDPERVGFYSGIVVRRARPRGGDALTHMRARCRRACLRVCRWDIAPTQLLSRS